MPEGGNGPSASCVSPWWVGYSPTLQPRYLHVYATMPMRMVGQARIIPTPLHTLHPQVLSLEDNCLAEWREVHRLAALPALQRLHLSNNPLTDVRYDGSGASGSGSGSDPTLTSSLGGPAHSSTPADPGAPAGFAALHCLVLGRCGLAEWGCVDQIGRFPALTELRITGE